jgi:hypothetical protein
LSVSFSFGGICIFDSDTFEVDFRSEGRRELLVDAVALLAEVVVLAEMIAQFVVITGKS